MNTKFGFIGGGNMASAIFAGMLKASIADPKDIVVYDTDSKKLAKTAAEQGIIPAPSNEYVIENCEVVFIALKPQYTLQALSALKPSVKPETAFVSIVAGWDNAHLKDALGQKARVLRVLPNTPLLAGAGMSCLCTENDLKPDEFELIKRIFSALGKVEMMSEKYFAAYSAVAGSGPAYVYMFIEALADAACLHGIPRNIGYTIAAQTVLGSAKLVLDSGKHPGELKDMVCSPAGTTIEGVYALEKDGFRAAVIDAVDQAVIKFNNL